VAATSPVIAAATAPPTAHLSEWSSTQHAAPQRYDAWAGVLGEYFLPWSVRTRMQPDFRARVRQRRLGDARFLRCRCEPLAGYRAAAELARTPGDFYNILYVTSGAERLRLDGSEVMLRAGEFVLWDSARRMDFEVLRPLDKLTLMVPEAALRAVLPNAADYVGVAQDGRGGLSALFAGHLRNLAREVWTLPEADAQGIVAPTLELFAQSCLHRDGRRRPQARALLLQQIRDYIHVHLADPALSPARIAAAHRISLRYLHALFAGQPQSVADFVRGERLERCRQALRNPALAHYSITAIAAHWGFDDPGHFARLFRQRYDTAPRDYRAATLQPA
jgi:AraC-like DNA-binding protein